MQTSQTGDQLYSNTFPSPYGECSLVTDSPDKSQSDLWVGCQLLFHFNELRKNIVRSSSNIHKKVFCDKKFSNLQSLDP